MQQIFYLKLKQILQEKYPDISCIKQNSSNSFEAQEFYEFLENTVQPYLYALSFVRMLDQNFHLGNHYNSKEVNQLVQASKKVFNSDNFANTLRKYCQIETSGSQLKKLLHGLQTTEQQKKQSIQKRIKSLIDQNSFFKNYIIAMSSKEPEKQRKAQKEYRNKRNIFEKFNRNLCFKQLDRIEKQKIYSQFVQQAISELQLKQQNFQGLDEQKKIIKIINDFKEAGQQISVISKLLENITKNIKQKQNYLEFKNYNYKLKNRKLENLLREFTAEIQKFIDQQECKQQKIGNQQSKISSKNDYLPQQGVTYIQLLQYIDCLFENIYSLKQENLAYKMEKIRSHILRQKQESNSEEHPTFTTQLKLSQLRQMIEENRQKLLDIQKINQYKEQNNQLHNILKAIFFQQKPEILDTLLKDHSKMKSIYQQESAKIIQFLKANNYKSNQQKPAYQECQRNDKKEFILNQQEFNQMQEQLKYYRANTKSLYDSLTNKQQTIKELQFQLTIIKNQNSILNNKINRHKQILESKFEQQLQQLKIVNSLKQEQVLSLKQQTKALKQQKIALQIQLHKLNSSFLQIKQQNEIKTNQLFELKQTQDIEKQKFHEKQSQLIEQHQRQLKTLQADFISQKENELTTLAQKYQKEIATLEEENLNLRQQFKQFRTKYYEEMGLRLLSEIQQKSMKNNQQQEKNKQLQELDNRYNQKFKTEIQTLQKQRQNLRNEINVGQIQKQQMLLKLIQKQMQIQTMIQENQQINSQFQNLKQKKEELQREYNKLLNNSRAIQQSIIRLSQSQKSQSFIKLLLDLENSQAQIIPQLLVSYTKALFNHDIFESDELHKQILIKHLEAYASSKISLTRLLYKYDPKNKVNFHQYIDDVMGLALVIKTKNTIIAGFYPKALREKEILNKGGLIVSVTNDKSYNLFSKKPGENNKAICRGMIYDTFFVIYGNAEIRVKTGFKTVFSNFGVSNSYFNARGDKVDKFLNEGDKREVQFEYCEFYQVIFQNQKFNE